MKKSAAVLAAAVCGLVFAPMMSAGPAQDKPSAAKPKTAAAKPAPKAPAKAPLLDASVLSGLRLRNIGPALMSGRVSDIVIHPRDKAVWYVAVGSGGVWKTVNAGTTWTPIFDSQGSYSIGCVALDPRNPETVWVGTGENVSGRHVGYGDGVYKSLNGGRTWTNMGLPKSEHIARILVDPRDSAVVYVAAEGPLWSPGGERGLYKSTDGGKTWAASLSIGPDTGVASAAFDPADPDTIYAAAYQRRRSVAAFMAGGPESGLYKTIDAGKTWRKLTVGLPSGDQGKIGVAVSPIDPRVVYATIEAGPDERGFYRSADRGESFEKRGGYTSGGTGPHYYQEIFADPNVFDRVWQMDAPLMVTDDGGRTFRHVNESNKHGDNHAMAFLAGDPDFILNGSDGGVYESRDGGKTWRFFENLPVTQFYKVSVDTARPFYNVNAGAQDNGSQLGPSRTPFAHGIRDAEWTMTAGADGYASGIDPSNPDIVYVEWQEGNLLRFDRKSGESVGIKPAAEPGDPPLRWNWDSPVLISPHAPARVYYASQFVYRSEDRGDSWTKISPDLTRGAFRLEQPIMGRTWGADALWDHGAMSRYGTVTTISESPVQPGLIYAGTDDGLIQATEDGGKTWRRAEKLPGIADGWFVNKVLASRLDANVVFAAVDRHKCGDYAPYVVRSADRGRTWTSIAGDLPARTIVWSLAQDFVKTDLLFAGTEFGIYVTVDGGARWHKLGGGAPTIAFRDIVIQEREGDLVAASFGRGVFILDDYSPLRLVDESLLSKDAAIFPVKPALHYLPLRPLDSAGKACLGDSFFLAPNPPFGAVFTYYLKETLRGSADARREDEKARLKAGQPVTFAGWDRLRAEEAEDKPEIVVTVAGPDGRVVRRLAAPGEKGIHRVAWDLRYPPVDPIRAEAGGEHDDWEWDPQGPLVVPGGFTVSLSKVVNGVATPLGAPQPFTVESLGLATLPAKDRGELLDFQRKAGELQRAMMGALEAAGDAMRTLGYVKKAIRETPGADPGWAAEAKAIEARVRDAVTAIAGDSTRQRRSEPWTPGLLERFEAPLNATAGATATVRRGYEIAADGFGPVLEGLRAAIERDLKSLQDRMEAAGAPWTPGRGVPRWVKK